MATHLQCTCRCHSTLARPQSEQRGSLRGFPLGLAPSAIAPTYRTPHKEDSMLLNITSIVLIALAVYGLIKLARLIYS